MRAGLASLALFAVAIVALLVRGAGEWSGTFATVWYATFGAAAVLAVVAVIRGLTQRRASTERRVASVLLALPALIGVALLVWFVVVVVPDLAD